MSAPPGSYTLSTKLSATGVAASCLFSRFDLALRRSAYGLLLSVCTFPVAAVAQTVFCLPPAVPLFPNDPQMLSEFRAELSAEFTQYFTDAQDYLNCLQHAHGVTRLEIEDAIRDYTTLLDTPPGQ